MNHRFTDAIMCIISHNEEHKAIQMLLDSMNEKAQLQEQLALERRACLRAIRKINQSRIKDDAIDALCDEENT